MAPRVPHGVRTFTAYAAVAGTSILAIAGLNLAADKLPFAGLNALRNYVTRANG